jgi:hypothetical protein
MDGHHVIAFDTVTGCIGLAETALRHGIAVLRLLAI